MNGSLEMFSGNSSRNGRAGFVSAVLIWCCGPAKCVLLARRRALLRGRYREHFFSLRDSHMFSPIGSRFSLNNEGSIGGSPSTPPYIIAMMFEGFQFGL